MPALESTIAFFAVTSRDRKTLEDAERIVEKRRGQSKTYTLPLPENDREAEEFQEDFFKRQLETREKFQEIKEDLKKHHETVQEHYRLLVPDLVSFNDFFCRYYYRCSVQRVVKELEKVDLQKKCTSSLASDDSSDTGLLSTEEISRDDDTTELQAEANLELTNLPDIVFV